MLRNLIAPVVVALVTLASPALAQGPERLQPAAPDFQQSVDAVFGDIVSGMAKYPFYNIASWFGLDTDPQFLRDEKGEQKLARTVLTPDGDEIASASFTAGDNILALTRNGEVLVIGAPLAGVTNTSARVLVRIRPSDTPTQMAAYPESAFGGDAEIMTVSGDTVRVWSVTARAEPGDGETPLKAEELMTLGGHQGGVTNAVYSGDGRWIATADGSGDVRLWDAKGAVVQTFGGHQNGVAQIAFGGGRVLTVDGAGNGRMWNESGEEKGTFSGGEGALLRAIAPAPVAEEGSPPPFYAALVDRGIQVCDASAGIVTTIEPGTPLARVFWERNDDGLFLRALSTTGLESWYEAPSFGEVKSKAVDFAQAIGVGDASGAGFAILRSDSDPTQLQVTRLKAGGGGEVWDISPGQVITNAGFNGSGDRLLTVTEDGNVEAWEWHQRAPDGSIVATSVPFVVLWLVVAAVFFTLFMRFVNFRMFKHAILVVAGKYSDPNDHGEVTHFQALSSALSATVGLGNIAGVAIAVSVGGPGAIVWMMVAGFLGMTLKFTECTLGQKFRKVDSEGRVSGGPMHYLKDGLAQKGLAVLGIPLALIFTVFCIGGSLAGGNAFQVNQSLGILQNQVPFFKDNGWLYGVIMAFFVGVVIIGGIRRIAQTAEKIVPTMCSVYVLSAMVIIVSNLTEVPAALGTMFASAFSGDAVYGGALGALIQGFRRAAFSNEAGVGSASIAHSAAKTPYPVREGIVALLEPFIDTVVVCTMTALVIVISGVYAMPEHNALVAGSNGAALTLEAFKTVDWVGVWFQWVLLAAVVLFAFSTMISWSYYGERCWTNMFGPKSSLSYKMLFLVFVVLGSVVTATNVLEFGDLMILLMAFPNILGLYFLSGVVKKELKEYEAKLEAGEIQRYK